MTASAQATQSNNQQPNTEQATRLIDRYKDTRKQSTTLCEPLAIEDFGLQVDEFVSPPKWHLAHTSWFFETFLLQPFVEDYRSFNPLFAVLFNSYYNGVGKQHPRGERGFLSRPSVDEVLAYRSAIDDAMQALLCQTEHPAKNVIDERCELGIQHEKQHQELLLTDILYSLSKNPLQPAYQTSAHGPIAPMPAATTDLQWHSIAGGIVNIGNSNAEGFAFDNELPAHHVLLADFALANRLVTNAEYQAFIDDGGYRRPELWLADGWQRVQQQQWQRPLYWSNIDNQAMHYGLMGIEPLQDSLPVSHISGYEADAYANWSGARLATEFEWEYVAQLANQDSLGEKAKFVQLYDSCWQWTASAYRPYPGFQASDGAIGEYNGKFMSNQWVLRGGSYLSPSEHLRPSYRNFFYPNDRWQCTGIRLARDL